MVQMFSSAKGETNAFQEKSDVSQSLGKKVHKIRFCSCCCTRSLVCLPMFQCSGSQPFMVYGPLLKTLNTCGSLLINRVLQYHGKVISLRPLPWTTPCFPVAAEGSGWETLFQWKLASNYLNYESKAQERPFQISNQTRINWFLSNAWTLRVMYRSPTSMQKKLAFAQHFRIIEKRKQSSAWFRSKID